MPLTDHIRPEPNPPLTVERVELARAMYVEGFTVARICSQCLMSLGTLYKCLDGIPFGPDGLRFPPVPRRRNILGKRRRALRADPVSLRNRLIRTAERQVRDIELRLSQTGRSGDERERDMRMLVSVMRAVRELGGAESGARPRAGGAFAPFQEPPRTEKDVSTMRVELARRLAALVAEAKAKVKD